MAIVSRRCCVSVLLLLILWRSNAEKFMQQQCEPITVEQCQGIGYNDTMKTMYLSADHDRNVEVTLSSFSPLIQYNCSKNLKFFLCSVLTPMCDRVWDKPIGPCRELCERVHRRCFPILQTFGFKWPPFLNCSRFPKSDRSEKICMQGNPDDTEAPHHNEGRRKDGAGSSRNWGAIVEKWRSLVRNKEIGPDCAHLRNKKQYVYINQSVECALACKANDLFTEEEKKVAEIWMGVLATLCAFCSLITILTFLIDRSRFKYPVRPVIFMSLCYMCYSISYFVRLISGREATACDRDPLSGKRILIKHGLENTNCAVVFLLQYFFSTAASAWFFILVLTWLLQAGWKWSPEAVAKRSCYFHVPAWIVPVSLTVCVLIVRKVEADELLGMCNVGNQSRSNLLTFVIIPNLIFLVLEVIFLIAGFIAMTRVRRHAKSDGQLTNKFDVLMGKIGLFSILYIIPTAAIVGINIYEYTMSDYWHIPDSPFYPSVFVFLLKVSSSLFIGMTTTSWICGTKTALAWRYFFVPSSRRSAGAYPKTAYQVGMTTQPGSPSWPKQSTAAHYVNGSKVQTSSVKPQQLVQYRAPDSTFL